MLLVELVNMRRVSAALVCCTAAAFVVPHQTRSTPRHAASARDVTPEQAEKMKAMGMRWDEERRTWTRRPADVAKAPRPLRSGMRLLKLSAQSSPDERAAAEVFMDRLRTTRKASFRDTDTSTKLSKFLKYCLSQPATLPVFAVACVGLGARAGTGADLGGIDATTLACGLAAAAPVAAARVAAHRASAGSEPPDGRALERSIADAATGSYAIPAPHDWRATEGPWKLGTIGLAAIADVPRVALLHGRIQPSFVPLEGDAWLGIAGAAAVATGLALLPAAIGYVDDQISDLPRDGRIDDGKDVERETAARFSSGARAFFAAKDDDAPEAKAAYVSSLADAWTISFTTPPPAAVRAARTAVESAAAAAAAASGGLAAAWIAHVCAAVAVVVFVDEDKNTCEVS